MVFRQDTEDVGSNCVAQIASLLEGTYSSVILFTMPSQYIFLSGAQQIADEAVNGKRKVGRTMLLPEVPGVLVLDMNSKSSTRSHHHELHGTQ